MIKLLSAVALAAVLVGGSFAALRAVSADDTTKSPACCGDECKKMPACCSVDAKGNATCSMGGKCCVKPAPKVD